MGPGGTERGTKALRRAKATAAWELNPHPSGFKPSQTFAVMPC